MFPYFSLGACWRYHICQPGCCFLLRFWTRSKHRRWWESEPPKFAPKSCRRWCSSPKKAAGFCGMFELPAEWIWSLVGTPFRKTKMSRAQVLWKRITQTQKLSDLLCHVAATYPPTYPPTYLPIYAHDHVEELRADGGWNAETSQSRKAPWEHCRETHVFFFFKTKTHCLLSPKSGLVEHMAIF